MVALSARPRLAIVAPCRNFSPDRATFKGTCSMKFYPHHINDYRGGTSHLSNEEDICYRRLLDRYYDTELPLEDDVRLLSRQCRVTEESVRNVLADFFTLVDGNWHNSRADAEIVRWYDKCHKAKQAIEARWAKKKSDTDVLRTNGKRNTESYDLDTTQDPIPNTQEVNQKTKTRATRYDAVASLSALGVSDQIARDWIKHRTTLKTTVTQTVIDGIVREAAKARIALSDALAMSCERGWRGFKAEWVAEAIGQKPRNGSAREDKAAKRAAFMAEITGNVPHTIKDVFTGNTIEGELL
jgi:uncharacterized protein YdaU (DUF1376 family)